MRTFVVLRPLEGVETMAQSQWTQTLQKHGHTVHIHNLRMKNVDPYGNLNKLVAEVLDHRPEMIFMEGGGGFNLPDFFHHRQIQNVPVVVFWYDAPIRSYSCFVTQPGYVSALKLPNITHFVWDGFWRKWFEEQVGVKSHPIHLAADPADFHPLPRQTEYPDHAVFVGTLVSEKHVEQEKKKLPLIAQHVAREFAARVDDAMYGQNPYQILSDILTALPTKMVSALEVLSQNNTDVVYRLNVFVWMIGKNEVRKRILREAVKVAPLLILSGNFEETHACEEELRQVLGATGDRLVVKDTRDCHVADLKNLYSFGRVHLQATDPQSIQGGIPFRVFQTTACRRPLLTDKKPELGECYTFDKELLTYNSEVDFAESLETAMKQPDLLETLAEAGYQRFLQEHTWTHRYEQVMSRVQQNSRPVLSSAASGKHEE